MKQTEKRFIEIRLGEDADRTGPGVLEGTLLTYGQRAQDRAETFEAGALHWRAGGVILNEQHNRQAPIMRFVPVVEGQEVRIKAALPDTQRGRDAATSVRNGTLRGLSVEFVAERERMVGPVRSIQRAELRGAGLVDDASYATAVSVRERKRQRRYYV